MEVAAGEVPIGELRLIGVPVAFVIDGLELAEGNIKRAARVEAAQPIEARFIQVKEQRRRFDRLSVIARRDQFVKTTSGAVVGAALVLLDVRRDCESALYAGVEIHQVRINVVQQCPFRLKAERNSQSSTERLYEPHAAMRLE